MRAIFSSVSVIWNVTETNEEKGLVRVSLTVDGPRAGNITYGPDGTPHFASVCEKSSSCFSRPIWVATSKKPPTPIVVFITNLVKSFIASPGLPWNIWLIVVSTSSKLLKKFDIPLLIGLGAFEYTFAVGLSTLLSKDSLNLNVARLIPSKGSLISSAWSNEIFKIIRAKRNFFGLKL